MANCYGLDVINEKKKVSPIPFATILKLYKILGIADQKTVQRITYIYAMIRGF